MYAPTGAGNCAAMKRNEKGGALPRPAHPALQRYHPQSMNRRSLPCGAGGHRQAAPGDTASPCAPPDAGFPGETGEQFEDAYTFVKEVRFDRHGSAVYSPRGRTPWPQRWTARSIRETKDRRRAGDADPDRHHGRNRPKRRGARPSVCSVTASTRRAVRTSAVPLGDAPEVDGNVCVSGEEPLYPRPVL